MNSENIQKFLKKNRHLETIINRIHLTSKPRNQPQSIVRSDIAKNDQENKQQVRRTKIS